MEIYKHPTYFKPKAKFNFIREELLELMKNQLFMKLTWESLPQIEGYFRDFFIKNNIDIKFQLSIKENGVLEFTPETEKDVLILGNILNEYLIVE